MELYDTYVPPGWRRGLAFLGLLAVAVLILATLALVPLFMQGHGIPEYAPYYYPAVGDPEQDLAALRAAVWFGAAASGLTALFLIPSFLLLHRWLIRQPLAALNGTRRDFRYGFIMALLVGGGLWAVYLTYLFSRTEIDPRVWIGAAPLAAFILIALLPLQVYAEELVFRGFLQRWLHARLRFFFVAMIVQSALFGLLHPDAFLFTFLLAIVTTLVTGVSGNLGAATGIHLAHNLGMYLKSFNPIENGVVPQAYVEPNDLPVAASFVILMIVAFVLPKRLERWALQNPSLA